MTSTQTKHILLLPGDGIGTEVVAATKRIIDWFSANGSTPFSTSEALIGGTAYDQAGTPLPPETLAAAHAADAVLMGAVGGPKWESLDYSVRPERGLLGIRKEMELFANLRPAICFDALADASSLKRELVSGLDIMIVRELTGGIYFGEPRGVKTESDGHRVGFNTEVYHDYEVQRIAHVAFDLAKKRGGKLCSVDKANVLEATEMWREEVQKIGDRDYPEIVLSHLYVDNAAMQLVRAPKQFDVMVTTNLFGDILSDCAAMLTGSLGMLPSASLGAEKNSKIPAVYEPVHGSAPDIAGKGIANPLATIQSFAMMLRYSFNLQTDADILEKAVADTLASGIRTGDIMSAGCKQVGTEAMADAVLEQLEKAKKKAAA